MIQKNSKKIYGDFFNQYDWDYYTTLTTAFPLSSKSSRRSMERFIDILNTKYEGSHHVFYTSEPFDLLHGYHLHCLIQIDKKTLTSAYLAKKAITNSWNLANGYNTSKGIPHRVHLQKYNRKLGGAWYISKYLNRPNADYDFLPHNAVESPRLFS